jgi:hypothetical protein
VATLVLAVAVGATAAALRLDHLAENLGNALSTANDRGEKLNAALQRETDERTRVQVQLYAARTVQTRQAWETDQIDWLRELLDDQQPAKTGNVDLRGPEWHFWDRRTKVAWELSMHRKDDSPERWLTTPTVVASPVSVALKWCFTTPIPAPSCRPSPAPRSFNRPPAWSSVRTGRNCLRVRE